MTTLFFPELLPTYIRRSHASMRCLWENLLVQLHGHSIFSCIFAYIHKAITRLYALLMGKSMGAIT